MVRRRTKAVFWLLIFALTVFFCVRCLSQDSAVEVFQEIYFDEEYETYGKDERQDLTTFFLCREIDSLRDLIAANELARREDDKELRAQIWKLALIVGGGGAIGGAGSAVVVKRRKRSG